MAAAINRWHSDGRCPHPASAPRPSPGCPTAPSTGLPTVTSAELATHRSPQDAWIALDGRVYDISEYIARHPAGSNFLLRASGRDVSDEFDDVHRTNARKALGRLPVVGMLQAEDRREPVGFVSPVDTSGHPEASFTIYEPRGGAIVYAVGRDRVVPTQITAVHDAFRSWIFSRGFPCAAGRTAIARTTYGLGVYANPIGDPGNAEQLARDLETWIPHQTEQWRRGNDYTTFVAVFPELGGLAGEPEFEHRLFAQLQSLHEADRASWPAGIPKDASNPEFEFAFGGRRYFVVGLHPDASRTGRRFQYPALAFNAMEQFGHLIDTGEFDEVQAQTRKNDVRLDGCINPNLTSQPPGISGAVEYSGVDHSHDKGWTPNLVIR